MLSSNPIYCLSWHKKSSHTYFSSDDLHVTRPDTDPLAERSRSIDNRQRAPFWPPVAAVSWISSNCWSDSRKFRKFGCKFRVVISIQQYRLFFCKKRGKTRFRRVSFHAAVICLWLWWKSFQNRDVMPRYTLRFDVSHIAILGGDIPI